MIAVHRRALRVGAAVLSLGLLAAGCGSPSSSAKGRVAESTTTTTIAKGPDSTAAQFRVKLNGLLEEHVYLAAAATGAAIGGRSDEFNGAAAALGGNTDALTANFTAIFSADVGKQFDALWKKHIELLVSYAQTKSAQALSDLAQYARDFGAFIAGNLPSLTADAVTGLVTTHVNDLKAIVDAQAGGNETDAFADQRMAATHMATVASGLAGAIHKKNPDMIGGDAASKPADLVTALSGALREHVFLTAAATDAIVGGRTDDAAGAKAALDANTAAITDAIAGIYGADAGKAFGPLWARHVGFLVDYATAVAAKQQPAADQAMANLLQYAEDFGAFLSGASPKLSKESVAALIVTHISTLKDIIDAQGAKNWTTAYTSERTAADHMSTVAATLAATIVSQFPNNY